MFYAYKSDISVRKARRFITCAVTVSCGLNVTSLPPAAVRLSVRTQCCNFNPFHSRFPSKYPSIGALLCIPNAAHGNIHVRVVVPNGRHYLITNYRLEFWPIRLLLVCCCSVAIVNVDVTMLTWWSGLSIMNKRPIVVLRFFAWCTKWIGFNLL
jgi:hypothetical protein